MNERERTNSLKHSHDRVAFSEIRTRRARPAWPITRAINPPVLYRRSRGVYDRDSPARIRVPFVRPILETRAAQGISSAGCECNRWMINRRVLTHVNERIDGGDLIRRGKNGLSRAGFLVVIYARRWYHPFYCNARNGTRTCRGATTTVVAQL